MLKDIKHSQARMKLAKATERGVNEDLFSADKPVWFENSGKVSPVWLSLCEEERRQTTNLIARVADYSNLHKAYEQVRRNGGSSGVDKQSIDEFKSWFSCNYKEFQAELLSGTYTPDSIRGVRIPKPQGGFRQLGIPTVKDRVVQQAINQVLQPIYDPLFSPNSYGFRPNRSAHQALRHCSEIIKSGKRLVIDLDLAKFFDEVNHQRLMWLLGTRIGDKTLLSLIAKILKTDILQDGLQGQRIKGTPQGSPLSPLPSNIILDELDQELMRRGLDFVRYGDDVQIFVSSKQSAERISESIIGFIERRMHLKVNRDKSGIRKCSEVTYLGYSFQPDGKLRLSDKSEHRLKAKIKEITRRNRGVSFEQVLKELKRVLQGWLQYFILARMKSRLAQIEGWLRRRLKCYRLKQCKRTIGIVRFLVSLGVEKTLSWRTALSGKGWWRLSNSPALNIGMNNRWFAEQGFYSLCDNYNRLFRTSL